MMTKEQFAGPNDSHIIKNCEYDREVLGSFERNWDTIARDR